MPEPIEVRKVMLDHVSDASGLAGLIDSGTVDADRVIAVIGKTEGNGGVNDYTRIIADRAFREVLIEKGSRGKEDVAGLPIVWSGGTDGIISPHATIFATTPASGAIATDDDRLAERARILRFHGSTDKSTFTDVGYNSRLDEVQAAVLRELLPELDGWNARRRKAAAAYGWVGLGDGVVLPRETSGAKHVYHLYVVRAERLPIGRGYYRVPVHRQPAIAVDAGLPATEEAARTNHALPMGIDLTEDEVRAVCASGST
jgi:hypothetical protein